MSGHPARQFIPGQEAAMVKTEYESVMVPEARVINPCNNTRCCHLAMN